MNADEVLVDLDINGRTELVGTAYFHVARNEVSTTFVYSPGYLAQRWAFPIDPQLPLSTGSFTVAGLPGALSDCAPDRWGRNLVAKQHQRLVASGQARHRRLTEVDYLIGVSDVTRQGALRFRSPESPSHLAAGAHVPPLIRLPELQRAADEAADGSDAAAKRLLDAGTGSLGGARPKASVLGDGGLMIAKFSRPTDDWSVIAWEGVALELASRAGISVPGRQLLTLDDRPVLVVDRFDRGGGSRVPYLSAMTATERRDGEPGDYLDIVEAIEDLSLNWRRDCAELFRRVVFSAAIHNTDDHLRNHGFLRRPAGWELSPVFDINPEPDVDTERQTAINGARSAEEEMSALLDFGSLCHLDSRQARRIMRDVAEAVGQWRSVSHARALPTSEIAMFGDVFDRQVNAVLRAAGGPI